MDLVGIEEWGVLGVELRVIPGIATCRGYGAIA